MRFGLLLLLLCPIGCTSRWAMDDPEYAEKYGTPYEPDNKPKKLKRMAKQLVDARHIRDRGGVYTEVGYQPGPQIDRGAEIGITAYGRSWWTGRLGFAYYDGPQGGDVFSGSIGTRLQLPSRVAPFVGVGLYLGGTGSCDEKEEPCLADDESLEDYRREDRESPGTEDEPDSTHVALYPEIGVHAWLNSTCRLTASARYMVSFAGRDNDGWLLTIGLTGFWGEGFFSDELVGREKNRDLGPQGWEEVAAGEEVYQDPISPEPTNHTPEELKELDVGWAAQFTEDFKQAEESTGRVSLQNVSPASITTGEKLDWETFEQEANEAEETLRNSNTPVFRISSELQN